MARETKADKAASAAVQRNCYGAHLSILDLTKIKNETRDAMLAGEDPDTAAQEVIAKYRKN